MVITKSDWEHRYKEVKMMVDNADAFDSQGIKTLLFYFFHAKKCKEIPFPESAPPYYIKSLMVLMHLTNDTEWKTLAAHWSKKLVP